ncbi:SUKH-4 family immunity protein [Streptomyces sp. NBC_01237]|uniref:SUKH-4 family immunity protein n=1 Tax=Streptomyces sp. NBC_01237 TaxID=2903790 RepID=UPI002DDC5AAA|nr:SUKH-4 family immunity protein [Streptomyces sp. NBC_01237]WRZ76396.1 SUKH-4 family immunity protein [Streptomyces sp. NBC_01237]
MLIDIQPEQATRTFGLTGITYFPRTRGGHLHAATAQFLSTVGLPSNKFFSPKLDLDDPTRLECRPSLKTMFDADGTPCPAEAENWEILGEFQYATVAIDPESGKIYSFGEGEEFAVPMHGDASSLVHALVTLEISLTELKKIAPDDDPARELAVDSLRQQILKSDATPFASEDGEWSKLLEEIGFGMWG